MIAAMNSGAQAAVQWSPGTPGGSAREKAHEAPWKARPARARLRAAWDERMQDMKMRMQERKMRGVLAFSVATALSVVGLAGCGKVQAKGPENPNPPIGSRPSGKASPSVGSRQVDPEVPNYWDNNRYKWPQDISPDDEAVAKRIADAVKPRLERLREQGRISPDEVRPVLQQAAGGRRVVAEILLAGAADRKTDGTSYGIWVGETGCVTGAVNQQRIWVDVNGRYIEHGCLTPPVGH